MRKSWKIIVFISVLFLSSGSVFSQAAETGETIGNIITAGNRRISSSEILSRTRSRTGELFDPERAAEDAKRIAELAGIEYSYYNTSLVDNKIQLTFVIVEKNIIRSIVFIGNHKYKAKRLSKKLGLKIADPVDAVSAQAGKESVIEFYKKKGFAFVDVTIDDDKLPSGELIYTVNEGPRVKIKSVSLAGNIALKTKAIKKALKTKKRKLFLWSAYYTEQKLSKDLTELQKIYYERGFLDADIKAKCKFAADKSSVDITFMINEGQVYTVEQIDIIGNEYFDDKHLLSALKSEQGQIYSEHKADTDVERLLKLYREVGFVDVRIERTRKFVSKSKVNIEFEVAEGQRFRIGQIDITGNQQTQDKVVRRILDEYDFHPGRWYNADVARGDGSGYLEKLVGSMAVTESQTSFITPTGQTPGLRDAQVSIIEGQTGMVMLGAGVASDSGVIGQLVYEQRNFDIKDWPESFSEFITGKAFRGAGQRFRIALQPGTEVSEYSVSFTEPYLWNKPISLDVVGSSYERGRESYDEQRTKGYVGFEKRYKNRWRRSIGFRVENIEVGSLDTDAPQDIVDVKGDNTLAAVSFGVGRDLTDDKFNPSKGYSFNASYEQASGDHTFGILSGTYRLYRTIYEDLAERKTILATKLLGATMVGDAPPFEKFYAGGSGTYGIRGFDYRGISTRGLQRNVANPQKKDPIGSDWIFLANAEVVVPLVSDNLAALFFVDSGTIDSGNYRAAVGTGIQIMIPQWFGPVPMRFEFAAPFMKDDDDETQVFSFSIGRLF